MSPLLSLWRSLLGATVFYTTLPLPSSCQPNFERIARWSSWIGLLIGGVLGLMLWCLSYVNVPSLPRGAIIVSCWVLITGGLHLDGAIDTADGLGVKDAKQQLEVMADSRTGAFGTLACSLIVLLKFSVVSSLPLKAWWVLLLAPSWGRISQMIAIAVFPYLKPSGKGAFHKKVFQFPADLLFGLLPISISVIIAYVILPTNLRLIYLGLNLWGLLTAIATSNWFGYKLNGYTGDTYGATVEWSEVFILLGSTLFIDSL